MYLSSCSPISVFHTALRSGREMQALVAVETALTSELGVPRAGGVQVRALPARHRRLPARASGLRRVAAHLSRCAAPCE